MTPAISVLVLVVASQSAENAAMVSAVREAMGNEVALVVRPLDDLPTEDEALALAASLHVDAVVETVWQKDGERRAVVGVHVGARSPWTHREIGFRASDDPGEQGRTVGFVVASMLPDMAKMARDAAAEAPPQRPDAAQTGEPHAVVPAADAMSVENSAAARVRFGRAADMAVTFAQPVGSDARRIGASLRFRWPLTRALAAHVGGSVRFGRVGAAEANVFEAMPGLVGLGYYPFRQGGTAIGLRLEAGVKWLVVTHFSSDDDAPTVGNRWLPVSSVVVDASVALGGEFSAILAVGPEVTFGKTDLYTHQQLVATLPVTSVVVDTGIRAYF